MKWRILVSLVTTLMLFGCATQKELIPTGGSRADGTVKLSYQFGAFEVPQVNENQGLFSAKKRCQAWGYSGAEAFGGAVKTCASASMGSCNIFQVTVEYQCTGPLPSSK
jgi:hypothetical protein